jgi:hypothetical protein
MIRLLFTILVCAVTSSQATAQNKVSQTLLGLSDDQRNETFTRLLRDNSAKCDRVIRTLFSGATVELDSCEALCRDGNSYSLTIPPEPNAGIELLSCRELLATRESGVRTVQSVAPYSATMGCGLRSFSTPPSGA